MADEKTLFKLSSNQWAGIIVTAVIGLPIAILTYRWTAEKPNLIYLPWETVTFPGDTDKFGMVGAWISNNGSKTAEHVEYFIELPDVTIQDVAVTPDHYKPVVAKKDHQVSIVIDKLIAGDEIRVFVKTTDPQKLPKETDPVVKSDEVKGEKLIGNPPRTMWGRVFGHVAFWFPVAMLVWMGLSNAADNHRAEKKQKELQNELTGLKNELNESVESWTGIIQMMAELMPEARKSIDSSPELQQEIAKLNGKSRRAKQKTFVE